MKPRHLTILVVIVVLLSFVIAQKVVALIPQHEISLPSTTLTSPFGDGLKPSKEQCKAYYYEGERSLSKSIGLTGPKELNELLRADTNMNSELACYTLRNQK